MVFYITIEAIEDEQQEIVTSGSIFCKQKNAMYTWICFALQQTINLQVIEDWPLILRHFRRAIARSIPLHVL
jgi:hypothetical protein